MKLTAFGVAIVCFSFSSLGHAYSGGDGSSTNPFQISSAADLCEISNNPGDLTYNFILTQDIDLACLGPNTFQMCGTLQGVFDGQGHTIFNLVLTTNEYGYDIGLFEKATGVIKNLCIAKSSINAPFTTYVGIFTGELGGRLENCFAYDCDVKGREIVGGLVGTCGTISKCGFRGKVQGSYNVGGIAGICGSISESFVDADVLGGELVGGVVGQCQEGVLSDCYSKGTVYGSDQQIGGFCGLAMTWGSPNFGKCYSVSQVSYEPTSKFVGGFVGRAVTYNGNPYPAISSLFWDTQISGMSISAAGVGKTTAQMQQIGTYSGWDFTNVWFMCGQNYPQLNWLGVNLKANTTEQKFWQMPASVTLDASDTCAKDDLNGYEITWNQVEGPTIIISEPNKLKTNFSPTIDGMYKFEITISKAGWALDHKTTVVSIGNQAPMISIPKYFYVWLRNTLSLKGTNYVTDDNGPDQLSYTWHVVIGPGSVQFLPNSTIADVNVLFAKTGIYTIRLTVTDGELTTEADTKIEVVDFAGGQGTVADPFVISSIEQFKALGLMHEIWDKVFVLTTDIDANQLYVVQEGSNGYLPIGTGIYPFKGIFDGQSHIIKNLQSPLFGGATGPVKITNLGIINSNILSSGNNVGALMGRYETGLLQVQNCYFRGGRVEGRDYVGGLIGSIGLDMSTDAKIVNCYVIADVCGNDNVGGLAGTLAGTTSSCFTAGTVKGNYDVGGICGFLGGDGIKDSYSICDVNGDYAVGGFAGMISGTDISTSYMAGTVHGNEYCNALVGFYSSGSVNRNCFWNIETSGQGSLFGTGATSAEMRQALTFTSAGWDFSTPVWKIIEGVDYPHLWWENTVPVVSAGADQVVYGWIDGFADVMLDGSDSNDADVDELTYKWTWTIDVNTYEANGVSPTIELPVGIHTIQLVVNDGYADSAPDDVNVTVVAPLKGNLKITPQTINRKSNQPHILAFIRLPAGIKRSDINCNEPITLYPGGIEASRRWIIPYNDGGRPGTGIFAFFDKDALMNAVPTNSNIELKVAGKFKSGQYFYGCETIRIISPKQQRP
jgi:hypothetical protein